MNAAARVLGELLTPLLTPRPDRRARLARTGVVHVERQHTGLCGFVTRCGNVFGTFDVDVTEDPVSCLICERSVGTA